PALAECSQRGALATVFIAEDDRPTPERIRDIARYPGVAIVATDATLPIDFSRSQLSPNLLLAQWLSPEHWPERQPWADLLMVCADEPELLVEASSLGEVPIIAARFVMNSSLDLASARAACDALQRDLAPLGQFAGYIV